MGCPQCLRQRGPGRALCAEGSREGFWLLRKERLTVTLTEICHRLRHLHLSSFNMRGDFRLPGAVGGGGKELGSVVGEDKPRHLRISSNQKVLPDSMYSFLQQSCCQRNSWHSSKQAVSESAVRVFLGAWSVPRLVCTLSGLPTLSFPRMPCGPSATRRLLTGSGAERKRKMHRRRWRQRPNFAKPGWSRWLSRSTLWPFRCNGTGMSSRGFFGRWGWAPWLPLLVLWQRWPLLGGEDLAGMSIQRCAFFLPGMAESFQLDGQLKCAKRRIESQEFSDQGFGNSIWTLSKGLGIIGIICPGG